MSTYALPLKTRTIPGVVTRFDASPLLKTRLANVRNFGYTWDMESTAGREFEIAAHVAELLDTLSKEQQRQVMALLASRYGLTIKDPPTGAGKGYAPRPRRRY